MVSGLTLPRCQRLSSSTRCFMATGRYFQVLHLAAAACAAMQAEVGGSLGTRCDDSRWMGWWRLPVVFLAVDLGADPLKAGPIDKKFTLPSACGPRPD